MTTIAYRNGIIAADTRVVWDKTIAGLCRKIHFLPDRVMAIAGPTTGEMEILSYYRGERKSKPKNIKDIEAIVAFDNKVWYLAGTMDLIPLDQQPYYAIGSGWRLALGGMSIGMSAKDAVKFAAGLDIYTNDIVDTYDIQEKKLKFGRQGQS